jgi:hypothetical protein
MIWIMVKSPRFYVWWLIFIIMGIVLRFLPAPIRVSLCTVYEQNFDEPALNALRAMAGPTAADTPTPSTAPATTQPSPFLFMTPEQAAATIRDLICGQFAASQPAASQARAPDAQQIAGRVIRIGSGGFVMAMLVWTLIPWQARKAEVDLRRRLQSPSDSSLVAGGRNLAIPARQLRIAVLYAVLSGAVTCIWQPNFDAGITLQDPSNREHMLALLVVACAAALWGTVPFARSDQDALVLGARLGGGGIFFGSLIALSITAPYMALTTRDGAGLTVSELKLLATLRLIALPAVSFAFSVAGLLMVRLYLHQPIRLFTRPTSHGGP